MGEKRSKYTEGSKECWVYLDNTKPCEFSVPAPFSNNKQEGNTLANDELEEVWRHSLWLVVGDVVVECQHLFTPLPKEKELSSIWLCVCVCVCVHVDS